MVFNELKLTKSTEFYEKSPRHFLVNRNTVRVRQIVNYFEDLPFKGVSSMHN